MQKHRSIPTMSLLFASISAILGSGWLFAAYYTAQIAGPSALLAWVLGGIAIIVIAFTYAEVSAMLPIMGSTARIPLYTHGTLVSFVYSWIIWLSYIALAPTEVQAVLQYLAFFIPSLTHPGGGLTLFGYIGAAILMFGITVFNLFSIRWLIRLNDTLTVMKIAIPIFISMVIILLLFKPFKLFHPGHSTFMPYGFHGVLTAISTGGVVFAFNGFKQACEMAGETSNPARAVPIAIIGSIVICLIIYLVLQLALFSGINPANLHGGWSQLTLPGGESPFAGLVTQSRQHWLIPILYIGATVGPLAAGLMYMSSSARVLFAMSKNSYLPDIFQLRNQHGHPWFGVIVCFGVGMLTFAPLPGWRNMISFLASLMAASYVIAPICLLTLRSQVPTLKRPFKLPFVGSWATIAFFLCNLLCYWTGWHIIWKMTLCIFASVIVFFCYHIFSKRGHHSHLDLKSSIWIWPYFTGLALISYLGNFGGGRHIIPFGWDIATLLIFSIVIMQLAIRFCLPADKTKRFIEKLQHMQEMHYHG